MRRRIGRLAALVAALVTFALPGAPPASAATVIGTMTNAIGTSEPIFTNADCAPIVLGPHTGASMNRTGVLLQASVIFYQGAGCSEGDEVGYMTWFLPFASFILGSPTHYTTSP